MPTSRINYPENLYIILYNLLLMQVILMYEHNGTWSKWNLVTLFDLWDANTAKTFWENITPIILKTVDITSTVLESSSIVSDWKERRSCFQ